jgi:hypothetical protein
LKICKIYINTCGVVKENEKRKYGLISMPKWCSSNAVGLLLSDSERTTVRIVALEKEEKAREMRQGGEDEDGIEGENNKIT